MKMLIEIAKRKPKSTEVDMLSIPYEYCKIVKCPKRNNKMKQYRNKLLILRRSQITYDLDSSLWSCLVIIHSNGSNV